MEKKGADNSRIIEEIDEDIDVTPSMKKENMFGSIDLDRNNIIISGQSISGKTTILNNMLLKYWIWKIQPSNIFIFSKTASFDLAYRPFIRWVVNKIKKEGGVLNIFESIDMQVIRGVVDEQKKLKKLNMAVNKKGRKKIEKILMIYDDILGDSQLKSHQSELSSFTCVSRHSAITNIFLTQNYTSIPSTIRRQTPLVFLLNMDNYSEVMAEENSLQGQKKAFMALYEKEIILKKDYSFLIIDKSAKHSKRLWKCDKGKTLYAI